ncbi:hypothetical protein, partial [Sulfitobacter sp.]|uniref:hypothetical protein n=1 Tax=Sulfitobacter sp. TaxID=1903071 RepID=UPI00272B8E64
HAKADPIADHAVQLRDEARKFKQNVSPSRHKRSRPKCRDMSGGYIDFNYGITERLTPGSGP